MVVELVLALQIPAIAKDVIHYPNGNAQQNPFGLDEYNSLSLKAQGFADYKRVIRGKDFVYADPWSQADLKRLVESHLMIGGEPTSIVDSCALFGGCVLIVDEIPLLVPQCCSTIVDFYSWKNLLSPEFLSGAFCIEGHPCPIAVKENNIITIECYDEDERFDMPAQQRITLELNVLATAIKKTEREVQNLSNKIDALSIDFGVAKLSDYLVSSK